MNKATKETKQKKYEVSYKVAAEINAILPDTFKEALNKFTEWDDQNKKIATYSGEVRFLATHILQYLSRSYELVSFIQACECNPDWKKMFVLGLLWVRLNPTQADCIEISEWASSNDQYPYASIRQQSNNRQRKD